MIARLTGKIVYKSPEFTIIDVNGMGYQVFVPLSTFYELPDDGAAVSLHTYTHVREDTLQLYGFHTMAEKSMFMCLTGISGIGPKLAVNILSGSPIADLEAAIATGDAVRLTRIPGVGKKTAERMVVELRDQIGKKMAAPSYAGVARKDEEDKLYSDAVSALVNLGYKRPAAEHAIDRVRQGDEITLSLEELLKQALKTISRV